MLLIVLVVVAILFAFGAASIALSQWRDPHSRGSSEYKPTVALQRKPRKAANPRQGSTRTTKSGAGYLYLISHPARRSLKVGISSSSSRSDRLADHQKYGWKVENLWVFDQFSNAEQLEGAVIAWWRNELRLPHHLDLHEMPQGGYTETVSADKVSIADTTAFLEKLIPAKNGKKAIEVAIKDLVPGAAMSVRATLKFVTKEALKSSYVSYSKRGNRYWKTRYHPWQRCIIKDHSGQLLLELNQENSIPIRELKIGSTVRVIGRVERVANELRMTNPIFEVLAVGEKGKSPKTKLSNDRSRARPAPPNSPIRQTSSITPKTRQLGSNSQDKKDPARTPLEAVIRAHHEKQPAVSEFLAERCSSCGALVPNGSAHDC